MSILTADYDFIRFLVKDIYGISRCKAFPAEVAEKHCDSGISYYANLVSVGPQTQIIENMMGDAGREGNCTAVPDMSTLHKIPWGSDGKYRVGQVFCDTNLGGKPQLAAPRFLAKQQLNHLEEHGLDLKTSFELEFTLETLDGKPCPPGFEAMTAKQLNKQEALLYDICSNLNEARVGVEAIHREFAPGQYEMSLEPVVGIWGADRVSLVKDAISQICDNKGICATFMTCPVPGQGGCNGAHFNHSLIYKNGENAMHSADHPQHTSELMLQWTAGLVRHGAALTAICCPTVNCYRRLIQDWSPYQFDWGFDNRKASFRLKTESPSATYIENRIPSGSMNPYLVLAANVAAGLDGIENKLELGKEMDEQAEKMPKTLSEALIKLKEDEVFVKALGKEFVDIFIRLKKEIDLYELQGSNVSTLELGLNETTGKVDDHGWGKERDMYFSMT